MSIELDHIWSQVQAQLALVVDEPTYRIWLAPLHPLELRGDRLLVQAPAHTCRWTRERFGRAIQASVALAAGEGVYVELVGGPLENSATDDTSARAARLSARSTPSSDGAHAGRAAAAHPTEHLGNPKLTFDQFVIGDGNRLAHAAALAVAEMPAHAYNPLFICGPPGVGKTHLLGSIANLLLAHNPLLGVLMTTGEAFTNEFVAALGGGNIDGFKARFRDVDVLLVDDVQFLERKARTEEEFFHTFNALHDSGRQLVLTSDRPPHDLQALEDRLRKRFQAGLVADIASPDTATRLAILRKRVHHDGIPLEDERALDLIADRVRSDVRSLEGALIRTVAYSSLTGRPLTSELAIEVLDGLYPRPLAGTQRTRTVADIQQATCELFGLSREELLSSSRSPRISWPRQLAMYLARELTDESLPAIGRCFGGRDHTTVLHACRRTAARICDDHASRAAVDKLRQTLASTTLPAPRRAHDRAS